MAELGPAQPQLVLPVDMFHEVQDVDDAGSNNVSSHVRLLLLPNFFIDKRTGPLGIATREVCSGLRGARLVSNFQ